MIQEKIERPIISFLVGSGFSIPEGLPSVGDINMRVSKINEEEILIHTDQTAIFLNGQKDKNRYANAIDRLFFQEFLEFYNFLITGLNETFHYEYFYDFYSSYIQNRNNSNEIEDFYNEFKQRHLNSKTDSKDCFNFLIDFDRTFNQLLASLLHKSKYHQDISISGNPPYDSFLNFLKKIIKSSDIKFHTLNHDLLFDWLGSNESGLFEHYSDGFELDGSPFYSDVRCTFNEGKINQVTKNYKVKLERFTDKFDTSLAFFKLHGSIFNKKVYSPNPNQELFRIKKNYRTSSYYMEIKNTETGKMELKYLLDQVAPDFLSGTTNKIRSYTGDNYYKKLLDHFKINLQKSELLFVTGYGFQDRGINDILEEHYLKKGKEMIVIDPYKPKSKLIENYKIKLILKGVTELTNQEYLDLIPEHLKYKSEKSVLDDYFDEF